MKDRLFLMQPGFVNAGLGPFYCNDSVAVEGMLSFFPQLRDEIEISYVPFSRPRQQLIDLVGEDNQGVPVLVLAEGSPVPSGKSAHKLGQTVFLTDEKEIREYLSNKFGLPAAG